MPWQCLLVCEMELNESNNVYYYISFLNAIVVYL